MPAFNAWWTTGQQKLAIELRQQGFVPREIGPRLTPPRSKEAVRKKLMELGAGSKVTSMRAKANMAMHEEIAAAKLEAPKVKPYKPGPLEW